MIPVVELSWRNIRSDYVLNIFCLWHQFSWHNKYKLQRLYYILISTLEKINLFHLTDQITRVLLQNGWACSWKKYLLQLFFASKIDWDDYMVFTAKVAFQKIGTVSFFSGCSLPLLIYHKLLYGKMSFSGLFSYRKSVAST